MTINEYFKKYMSVRKHSYLDGDVATITRNPLVVCKDGFVMSVQVGESLYSSPRSYTTEDYAEAEVGFPSERESLLEAYVEGYCDEDDDYTDMVYPYVPCDLIDKVIEKHGGVDEDTVQLEVVKNAR